MIGTQPLDVSTEGYERVASVFPEIVLIENESLRRKVAAVWLRTWELSGSGDPHEAIFMPHLPSRTLVAHTRGVTNAAIGIARGAAAIHGMVINLDRLVAAAILHDAAKCVEYERKSDGSYGRSELGKNYPHSFLVCEIGRQVGVPEDVNHLVAQHSPNSPLVPRYIEGVILAHADLVDADCMNFTAGILTDRVKKGLPANLYGDVFS